MRIEKKLKSIVAMMVMLIMLFVNATHISMAISIRSGELEKDLSGKHANIREFNSHYVLKYYTEAYLLFYGKEASNQFLEVTEKNIADNLFIVISDEVSPGEMKEDDALNIMELPKAMLKLNNNKFAENCKGALLKLQDVENVKIELVENVYDMDYIAEKTEIQELKEYKIFKNNTTNTLTVTSDSSDEEIQGYIDDLEAFGRLIADDSEKEEIERNIQSATDLTEEETEKNGYVDVALNALGSIGFVQLKATTTLNDGSTEKYCLVIGSKKKADDGTNTNGEDYIPYYFDFYWVPESFFDKKDDEFDTTMSYTATVEGGKVTDGTFFPPYVEDNENKKDADVTVTIKSKTDEEIVAIKVNGTEVKIKDEPNSEDWYYPDVKDKTVIAKKYPFDKYDNTNYYGKVKEEIEVVGTSGRTSTQNPSIEWTFRIVKNEKITNDDNTVTVTITYNLPIDEDSIPEGWSPVYDSDGKTVHAITRTFAVDETYDKDVTVKQKGTDKTATTHVKVEPTVFPQAGETMIFAIIIAGITIFAITRFRKIDKNIH